MNSDLREREEILLFFSWSFYTLATFIEHDFAHFESAWHPACSTRGVMPTISELTPKCGKKVSLRDQMKEFYRQFRTLTSHVQMGGSIDLEWHRDHVMIWLRESRRLHNVHNDRKAFA
jgi:hypothetical protein